MPLKISPQRKAIYRVGQIMIGVGVISFLSAFVTTALGDGFSPTIPFRAGGGVILIMGGAFLCKLGFGGAAGSLFNLDPEQARQDLEPWARMSGGLQKDALDEMGIDIPAIVGSLAGRTTATGETFEQRLRGLHALYKDGILSREEYEREKRELLDGA